MRLLLQRRERAKVPRDMLASLALLALVTIQVIDDEHFESATISVDDVAQSGQSSPSVDHAAEVQAKVVTHCEIALGRGECRPATTASEASARVVFETDRVVVTLLSEANIPSRSLDFSPTDTPEQRQVAAGLLVAAMSAAARSEREEQIRFRQEAEAEAQGQQAAQKKHAVDVAHENKSEKTSDQDRASEEPHLLFDGGATFAPPLDGSEINLGVLLRTTWQANSLNGYFIEFRFAQSLQSTPRLRFGDAALGATLTLTKATAPLCLWLHASAVLNLLEVSQVTNLEESQITFRGGARLGLGVAPRLMPLSPWLGVDVVGLAPTVEIQAGDELMDRVTAFTFTASLGLRWDVSP